MSESMEVGCAGLLGNVGEDLEPGAYLSAQVTEMPRRRADRSRRAPSALVLFPLQPGYFLL